MPADFNGKWKVKSTDGKYDEVMDKMGYPAEVKEYMKTKVSFELKQNGDNFETTFASPDGKVKTVKAKIGEKTEEKDFLGRPYTQTTKWDGDKLMTDTTPVGSEPKSKTAREIKGETMVSTTTLVDSGLTTVTVFEKC